jgi:DNA replication protein DnaC
MPHTATLPLLLKQLKLSSMARHWEELLPQAREKGWNGAEYLTALCELELAERYSRRIARYAKESQLPAGKSLATFDFTQVPDLLQGQIEALATTGDWTARARNLLLFGASGVGKTHLAAAIGHGLVERGVVTLLSQWHGFGHSRCLFRDIMRTTDQHLNDGKMYGPRESLNRCIAWSWESHDPTQVIGFNPA